MKPIEESAKNYLSYERDFLGRKPSDNMVCRAYVEGATEQKKIDIVKACEWFSEHMIEYACYNEMDGWDVNHKEMHKDFRKAMEE